MSLYSASLLSPAASLLLGLPPLNILKDRDTPVYELPSLEVGVCDDEEEEEVEEREKRVKFAESRLTENKNVVTRDNRERISSFRSAF